ncbi:cation transporter [Citricoccus sp. SGAir0253]|uniref:cation transporter n=1 Tax=Citricoccus sp. SGAir0253 TaxID=2567881 RepID=UPI0010CD4783|nr:cation transporter [Citricoccus sp. SGAir0253]QCU77536.1 cation transporter [Citricoccus sp. SGAir0253]
MSGNGNRHAGRRFGRTELPPELQQAAHRAIRLEWITLGVLAVTVLVVGLVTGSSQAMKAAWIEDMLSFVPPTAFLVAMRVINRPPSRNRPYGNHRAIGIGHLVAGVALLTMGVFLVVDSAIGLVTGEHPPIGSYHLFGQTIWMGWFMIVVMLLSVPGPVILGRMKLKIADQLHDKVLYADADMNKADWQTGIATAVGVAGVGLGWWWADAAAAIFVGASIVYDGVRNVGTAVTDLADARARTIEGKGEHPLVYRAEDHASSSDWVRQAGARVRDEGHVFHVEMFVVPEPGATVTLERLQSLRDSLAELDWKLEDIVVVPVPELPAEVHGGRAGDRQAEGGMQWAER